MSSLPALADDEDRDDRGTGAEGQTGYTRVGTRGNSEEIHEDPEPPRRILVERQDEELVLVERAEHTAGRMALAHEPRSGDRTELVEPPIDERVRDGAVHHRHGEASHAVGKHEELPVAEVARQDERTRVARPDHVLRPPGLV